MSSTTRCILVACLFPLGLWLGCNQVAGIREGKPYPEPCKSPSECDQREPACRTTTCENEQCVYMDLPEGTALPLEQQKAGDCVEVQCDGTGRTSIAIVPADIPDDDESCTVDECIGSEPRHTSLSATICYSGALGTEGVGNCRAGIQACVDGKPSGPCFNERIPQIETCLNIFDDDCDGSVNEEGPGCICVPGSLGECYPGNEETLGYGLCASGTQVCNAMGTAYEACSGFVDPLPEVCDAMGEDEDCDGRVNEEGPNCTCGDGIRSNGESCDDGNTNNGDGCTNECKLPTCGNGLVNSGEECDDQNQDNADACTNYCTNAICGDGLQWFGMEECDDGNLLNGDGCTAVCKINVCGDGIIQIGVEQCDDAGETSLCSIDCKIRPSSSCADVKAKDPAAQDGDYTLYVNHDPAKPWLAYCHTMDSAPLEYLSLLETGTMENFSQYSAGGARPGTDVITKYTKIRLSPSTFEVDRFDMTFATSVGMAGSGPSLVVSMPYGQSADCKGAGSNTGPANINLLGTPFRLPMGTRFQDAPSGGSIPKTEDIWCTLGFNSAGSVNVTPDLKIADLTGGGFCGVTVPKSPGSTACDNKLVLTYAP